MRRSNIFLRIGVLLLIGVMATSGIFVGSGTFAKYVADAGVSAMGHVARFDVRVERTIWNPLLNDGVGGNAFVLSGNIADPYTILGESRLGTVTQEHNFEIPHNVYADAVTLLTDDGSLIAPGTGGKILFNVHNFSEVAVDVSFSEDSSNLVTIPNGSGIQFSYDSINWTNFSGALTALNNAAGGVFRLPPMTGANAPNISEEFNDGYEIGLYWRWEFQRGTTDAEQNEFNSADTALGVTAARALNPEDIEVPLDARPKLIVPIKVNVEQVD